MVFLKGFICFLLIFIVASAQLTEPQLTSEVHSANASHLDVVDIPLLPVGGYVRDFQPSTVEAMRSAGMVWAKVGFHHAPGADLSIIETLIDKGHQAGFSVMVNVRGNPADLEALGADYYPAFAKFCGEIASLGPDAIEVWREMNLGREWIEGQIDPSAYVDMLSQAYTAIKTADPSVLVITGALLPSEFEISFGISQLWDDDHYYQGMAAAGAASFADCIGISYTEGAVGPDQTKGDPRGDLAIYFFPTLIQRAATAFEGQDIPLCLTNLGYLSPDAYSAWWVDTFDWARNTTASLQAKWLRDVILAAGADERVMLAVVWNVDYQDENDASSGWAIIRPDGTCPACKAIGSLTDSPRPNPTASVSSNSDITATISETVPAVAFSIPAQNEKSISIDVIVDDAGTLDPVLIVYDSEDNFLAFNDDISATSNNSHVGSLPGDVSLIAIVFAFNGESAGDFSLSVRTEEAEASLESRSFVGTVTASSNVNIRSGPGTNFSITTTVVPGATLEVLGRNHDASWLSIRAADSQGWIARSLISTDGEVADLPIVE